LSKQFDDNNNNNVAVEKKIQRRLWCGVAFLEIEWTSGFLFIDSSLNQTKYHIIYYQTK
jgi:ABC-type uncharacterized transport system permease subunit